MNQDNSLEDFGVKFDLFIAGLFLGIVLELIFSLVF